MSSRATSRLWITVAVLAVAAPFANAQYPGQSSTPTKTIHSFALSACSSGPATKNTQRPAASFPSVSTMARIFRTQASICPSLSRWPSKARSSINSCRTASRSVSSTFRSAARQQGSWIGLGKWKALPNPKPAPVQVAKIDEDDAQSDVPILHRKHHSADSGDGSAAARLRCGHAAPAPDPDRPTLHKGPTPPAVAPRQPAAAPARHSGRFHAAPDPDRPTLHRSPDSSSSTAASASLIPIAPS